MTFLSVLISLSKSDLERSPPKPANSENRAGRRSITVIQKRISKCIEKHSSSSLIQGRSVALVTVLLGCERRTSLFSLQRLVSHFIHSEWSHAASVVSRPVGFVVLRASRDRTFVIESSHVGRWATLELPLSEWKLRWEIVVVPVHLTSVLGSTVVIQETIRIRSIHHLAIATCSGFLVVGVEILGVLRTFVEASSAVISVAMIVSSGSGSSIVVLILRRESPSFVRM